MTFEQPINKWSAAVIREDERTGHRTKLMVSSLDPGNWRIAANNGVVLRTGLKLRSEALSRAKAMLEAHSRQVWRELFAGVALEALYQTKKAPDEFYRHRWAAKVATYDGAVRHLLADFREAA